MTENPDLSGGNPKDWGAVDPFDSSDPYLWVRLEHLGRYLFALDYFRETGMTRVLDAGAGTGYGCGLMADGGLDVTALDLDAQLVGQYTDRCAGLDVRGIVADLEQGARGGVDFDGIVVFEVLEHLRDPRTALAGLVDRLRPAGKLLVSVPNRVWESRTTAGLPTNQAHRVLFGRREIVTLIEGCGLSVSHVLGQGLCNYLMRRELSLLESGRLRAALGKERALKSPNRLKDLARLFAYPTADYAEWSYSFVMLATKPESRGQPVEACTDPLGCR